MVPDSKQMPKCKLYSIIYMYVNVVELQHRWQFTAPEADLGLMTAHIIRNYRPCMHFLTTVCEKLTTNVDNNYARTRNPLSLAFFESDSSNFAAE